MEIFDIFDPSNWGLTPDAYRDWWLFALSSIFYGFVPRLTASICLSLSIFSMVTRRFRPAQAVFLFLVSVFITYGGGVLRWLGVG